MDNTTITYVLPIVIGLGGILWYVLNNKKEPQKKQPTPIPDSKPTPKPQTPRPVSKRSEKASEKSVKIFFGSQTGTAEDFSHKLSAEGKKYGFETEVIDCEEYDSWDDLSNENVCIFVMATYGEGEPTDNARAFDEWLNDESIEADKLTGMKFTVFGLGNKTYEQFNAMGRKVDKRMEDLGATRVYKKGEGDDDGSLEDDFAAWKKDLWTSLCAHFGIQPPADVSSDLDRRFRVSFFTKESNEAKVAEKNGKIHLAKKSSGPRVDGSYDIKNPYMGKIVVNKELHGSDSDRSCRHIEIEVGGAVKYEAGDHIGVYPENQADVVAEMAQRLGVELDAIFAMYPADKPTNRPVLGPCTVRQALTQWTDLTNPPRKNVIKVLAHYATDPQEKEKLLELSDDTKAQPYGEYIKEDHRTVLCLLNENPSVKIPFDHFIEILPRLAARYYSISSSLKEHPGKVHVTSVVVEFTTNAQRKHKGVCSNWLATQVPKEGEPILVPVFIEKANFKLPKDPKLPVIMVGPGTGLAPFRGFLHERKHQLSQGPIGETVLFFGCRHPETDYIYKEELEHAKEKGYLTHLFVAFSRAGKEKVYVQHKMEECSQELWELMSKGGYFYVCGDARNMAKDVRQTLKNTAIKFGGYSEEDAEKWIGDLQKQGRYLTDVWF